MARLSNALREETNHSESVPGPPTIGKYRVIRLIGRGSAGFVYEAEDQQLGRRVAIKVLRSDVGDAFFRRFHREASLAAGLMHPGIVTIHEVSMPEKASLVTPSPFTPLGAKGAGESAIHTTPAAIMCAINDALLPLKVRATEVPASPNRVWKLIQDAQQQ